MFAGKGFQQVKKLDAFTSFFFMPHCKKSYKENLRNIFLGTDK